MPIPTPGAGYIPTFHVPIIGPPPAGTSPASHYRAVTAATSLRVSPVTHSGLDITLSNASFSPLFAMVGGLIRFIPAGTGLTTADPTPLSVSGSLVIQTWVVDVQKLRRNLPPGVPPPTTVLYLNVQPATVREALRPLVHALPIPVLEEAWNGTSSPRDQTALDNNYLDLLMLGQGKLFVPGGTPLGNADYVTPGTPASGTKLTLRFTDGAANDLSPILHLGSMPSFGAQWADHPLVAATANIAVPVDIYLRFEVWDETTHVYAPLPAGVAVDLIDHNDVMSNVTLRTQRTVAHEVVHFNIPNRRELSEPEPDLFFLVRTSGLNHAHHTIPTDWSTKGWKATDGSPGYYENFRGTQLGDATSPLVFRIGVDFHARFEYLQPDQYTPPRHSPTTHVAPPGIPVSIHTDLVSKRQMQTNQNGAVHGVIFDISAGDSIHYSVEFEMTDPHINLPRAQVMMAEPEWRTFSTDADRKYYPDNDRTTLGSFDAPEIFRCSANDRDVALYFLKILRELSTFLFHMTQGAWSGVDGLTLFLTAAFGPYSWPVGEVNINPEHTFPGGERITFHWDRATLIHELSHQIMWKEVGISSEQIALEFGPTGELHGFHRADMLANKEHALIEGWAEFFEAIFEGSGDPPYDLRTIVETHGFIDRTRGIVHVVPTGLGLLPPNRDLNRGEKIEGAFANGLWAIFKNQVVTSASARVPESANGDVTSTAPWLTNPAVRDRFLRMIWRPLSQLRGLSNPKTSDMHSRILASNPERSKLMGELQRFNEAMEVPTVSSIFPNTGPAARGQHVTIRGTNFVAMFDNVIKTTVTIGGTATTNVSVDDSGTSLTADFPPGPAGRATIVVTTPAGSATDVYTYV